MIYYKYSGGLGIRVLDDLRLKVTPPDELNDPFELTPRSKCTMTQDYIREKIRNDPEHFRWVYDQMVEKEGLIDSFADFLKVLARMPRKQYSRFLRQYRDGLIETDLKSIQDASKLIVVLCLSSVNNSIPMWSHYGNHHKGIVIGLNANDPCFGFGSGIQKVLYRSRRVAVDPLGELSSALIAKKAGEIILTKSKEWDYEQEYRISFPKRDVIGHADHDGQITHLVDIWPQVIREVILGCCISTEYERQVREILRLRRFSHVALLRAHRDKTKFHLEIRPA